jgi:drug/metabolite transporter (DMT)-like permease
MEMYSVFIVSAIFAWALSAPLIQRGMKSADSGFKVASALLVSFGIGYFFLFFSTGRIGILPLEHALLSFAAGLLTFPLGTGLYYFTIGRISAKNMMPFLYLKLPLALFLSYFILGEVFALSLNVLLGMAVLVAGLVIASLSMGGKAAGRGREGRLMTLLMAVSIPLLWALGEIAIKLGSEGIAPIRAIFYSLTFGFFTVAGLMLLYSLFRKRRWRREDYMPGKAYLFFAGHGFLSIFVAYTLYFWAIGIGSVSFSALLVAVWPLLAMFLSMAAEKMQGIPFRGRPGLLVLGAVLCFVSEIAILTAY